MKVDELLERSVLTPTFTCAVVKPKEGSIHILDDGKMEFCYAKGIAPYLQDDNDLKNYLKVTGCAQFEVLETNDIKILHSFLKLAEDARKEGKKAVIPIRRVLDICYTYGFPMAQMPTLKDKGKLLGFSITRFLSRLDNLYVCYALWKALQIGDTDLIEQVQPHPMNANEMQLELEHRLYADISIKVLYQDDQPALIYQADNLMALVEAQLAVLISKGANYLDGGCITYCADCGQPFIKYRSNSTLCEKCKGNTGKSRRYRAKKKGDQNNG